MKTPARLLVAIALAATPLVACVSNTADNPLLDLDGGSLVENPDAGPLPGCANGTTNLTGLCVDATLPEDAGIDRAAPADVAVPDSTAADTNRPDTNQPDTNVPDTSVPDTNVPDTNVPDTNVPDTNVPDTNVPDTNVPDTNVPDTSVPVDSGPDVFDAGEVAFDAGPDVFDAGPPHCATAVFSNYYLRTDGTVMFYNGNTYEVVIDATSAPLDSITQVFAYEYAACGLRNDGTVWCWATFSGNNTSGELGNGTFVDSATTFRATQVEISHPDGGAPVYLDQVTAIPSAASVGAAGSAEPAMCAIRTDKTLWCWGPATQGHLWEGTTGSNADLAFATPIRMQADAGAPISNVDQVSCGGRHVCFVSGGDVYCWGNNTSGELGTGDTTDQPYPFKVTANLPANITQVAAGADQTCVLANQNVYCWGADTYNAEGNPFVDAGICNSNYCEPLPVEVQAAFPDGGFSQNPLGGIASLAMGDDFACGLDTSGIIHCWGASTGTPTLEQEAIVFVNPQAGSGVPSGPATSLSGISDGFNTQLRYVTTSGVYVYGTQIAPQVCP